MLNQIMKIIDVTNTDPDDRRKARLLNILLLGMAVLAFVTVVLVALLIILKVDGWENLVSVFWSGSLFLLGIVLVYVVNQHGYVFAASIMFLLIIMVTFTLANIRAIGNGATQFYFVIPVLIASVLITPASSFVLAAINSAIFVVAAIVLKLEPDFYIGIFGMFAIAVVSWISARVLENALKDLRIINQELDHRVEKRTQELAEANERLKGLDELKSKFVSDVSHELRTPISNLSIYLEMLEDGDSRNTDRYLAVLREETSRLKKLVADVLDLARMETESVEPQLEWRNINAIVDRVFVANQLRADVKGLTMRFLPAKDLPEVYADSDQLVQALNNLVGNSVNYTEKGQVVIRSLLDSGTTHIVVEVSDTGMGIAEQDIAHIFDRFYRGKRAGQSAIPGTGLGLAITKEIIERHGGEILVKSKIGEGTIFSVHLPLEFPETE